MFKMCMKHVELRHISTIKSNKDYVLDPMITFHPPFLPHDSDLCQITETRDPLAHGSQTQPCDEPL